MNCKPGDLAVIIKSKAGNEGKIVKVQKFLGWVVGWEGDDRWLVDQDLPGNNGGKTNTVRDAYVRPIRDQDGEDEMLRIAGKPKEKETK